LFVSIAFQNGTFDGLSVLSNKTSLFYARARLDDELAVIERIVRKLRRLKNASPQFSSFPAMSLPRYSSDVERMMSANQRKHFAIRRA
jgi:hypothetical protein